MNRQELDAQLSPIAAEQTRPLRSISVALVMGVVIFAALCGFLASQHAPAPAVEVSVANLLTLIELGFACAACAGAFTFPSAGSIRNELLAVLALD